MEGTAMKLVLQQKGKYSEIEEAILAYLYEHPGENIGTGSLMKMLRPDKGSSDGLWQTPEAQRQVYEEIQFGIETLIKDKLVKGKRGGTSGNVENNQQIGRAH